MNIAMAGYGFASNMQLPVLKKMGRYPILLLGSDATRTEEAAKRLGIPNWSVDFKSLLDFRIDVVHINTPPSFHLELIEFAAAHGINIICEKPLVLDPREGEKILKICEKSSSMTALGFNKRFYGGCLKSREIFSSIGDVFLIHGSYLQQFHALPCDFSWRYTDRYLATTEIGSHFVDMLTFISGLDVVAVSAIQENLPEKRIIKDKMLYDIDSPETPCEGSVYETKSDTVVIATLYLSNGTAASMVLSEMTQGCDDELSFTFTGSKGTIFFNSVRPDEIQTCTKGKDRVLTLNPKEESTQEMFEEIYRDFENGKKSESSHYASLADGVRNAKILQAIGKSAARGGKKINIK